MGRFRAEDINIPYLHPADPLYGLSHSTIVERLTPENWREKATVRWTGAKVLYIYVQEYWDLPREETTRYLVWIVSGEAVRLGRKFHQLDSALAYANGEDGGELSETVPGVREQWPTEQAAAWVIVLGSSHRRSRP